MKTEPSIDPTVLALTGQLPSIIILAAVLAYPISLFLLWLYRRAVMRLMNQQTIRLDQTWSQIKQSTLAPRATVLPSLELITISASAFSTTKKYSALCQVIMKRPWQASAIYGIAGAVFVLIMTIVWLISGDIELSFFRCLMIFWIMAWPIVLTTNFITATTNRISLLSISLYFAIYFLMTIIALVRNPDFTVFQVLELWFAFNLAPTALLLTFLNRQVRAVGPMLLVFLMMALLGAVVTTELIGKNETSLRTLISVTSAIGIGDYAFLFMFIVGFSGFSILGWLLAIWIRKGYVTKKLSDQTIVLDSIWIIFGIAYSVSLAFEDIAWILSFFVAFLLYKIVVQIGFRIANPVSANTRLLILRVFQLGKRSERIFDAITKYWRYGGSVQFIAGPDLATSTVQPHEFLAFLSKKITRLFIHTKPELDEHLSNMDLRPDFDGRFRINDFFCYESTWEMVLSKLVQHSDAVLMDLRSFSPERKGCIREISELINIVPVGRIVLVIDESTDLAFLKQTIRQYWSAMIAASPNATGIPKALRLFYTDSNQEIPIIALINELSAAN